MDAAAIAVRRRNRSHCQRRIAPAEPSWAHLIGAAGSGMRSLAEFLRQGGWRLTGSDLRARDEPLHDLLVPPWHETHDPAHVDPRTDLTVYSDAIGADHCERRQAEMLGIPCRSYPQMLAELMTARRGVAVAGTHGKSTTTALLAECFWAAGAEPGVVFGADHTDGRPGGRHGHDDTLLVEACEYRGNFLALAPAAAIVLNVEWDHVDAFPTPAHTADCFAQFVRRLPPQGLLVLGADCPQAAALARRARCRVITAGTTPDAEQYVETVSSDAGRPRLRLHWRGRLVGEVQMTVPGRHLAACAAAAAALALAWGLSGRDVLRGLAGFAGLRRRLERLGTCRGIEVWDDYAHHPTAVSATLETLREARPGRRLVCVLEPHQTSRLTALLDEFAASLHNADVVGVTGVFQARETASTAAPAAVQALLERLRRRGVATLDLTSPRDAPARLTAALSSGDVLATLGAGDVRRLADGVLDRIDGDRAA